MDLRAALRLAWRQKALTLAILLTLALSIGANTALFSIADTLLLRPLPFPEPERLVQIATLYERDGRSGRNEALDGASWELVRDHVPSLQAAVEGAEGSVNLARGGVAVNVRQQKVSTGYFAVLGLAPVAGREFTPAEDRKGGPPVVLLSDALWRGRFAADPAMVGQPILLRGEPYTVVGILPPVPGSAAELWTPLRPSTEGEGRGTNFTVIGRLRGGATAAAVAGELDRLSPQLRHGGRLTALPLQELRTAALRRPVLVLWGAVGVVLLIGCVNIGGMLLARGAARSGEMATRLALGAPARRIAGQLLVESLVLAAAGAALGIGVGWALLAGLKRLAGPLAGSLAEVTLDPRVLGIALAAGLATSLVFGLFPVAQALRVDLRTAQGSARTVAGGGRGIPLGVLAAVQVALAVPLLVSAALLVRSFSHLASLDPGFDPAQLTTASFSLEDARYGSAERVNQLFDRVLERLRETPGIEAAAVALTMPYERALNEGIRLGERQETVNVTYATPSLAGALRLTLLAGRFLEERDTADSARVAVANRAFVRRYFPGEDPVGRLVRVGGAPLLIVGVIGDVPQRPGFGNYGPLAAVPGLYVPARQCSTASLNLIHGWFSPSVAVRTPLGEAAARAAVVAAFAAADPLLPVARFRSAGDLKGATLALPRFMAAVLGGIAALALGLSALGLHGLIANQVAGRRRELGIRLALGAPVGRTVRLALRPAVLWSLAGLIAGAGLATGAAGLLRGTLWGIGPTDPVAGVAAGAVLVGAAVAAALGPAARIARISPAETLRAD